MIRSFGLGERTRMAPGWLLGSLAVVVTANVVVLGGWTVHFITPALGLGALVGVPVVALHRINLLRWAQPVERWVLAVLMWLLILMVAGLVVNELLPALHVSTPLSTSPVIGLVDLLDLVLIAWSSTVPSAPLQWWDVRPRAVILLFGGGLAVALSVAGAVRLDNGLGGGVAHAALGLDVLLLALLLAWREKEADAVLGAVIYCVGLGLLFSTSLRSWYSTGHDIQHEMQVFLQTAGASHWVIGRNDPYNACLSLTILPTIVLRWTQVQAVYVFKVIFELLFALSPVLLFSITRRIAGSTVAAVSVIYFLGFITFFEDMPWLNRQQIGLLFFGALLLAMTHREGSPRNRQVAMAIFIAGMVLSHYSTSYFALVGLGLAWLLQGSARALSGHLPAGVQARNVFRSAGVPSALSLWVLVFLAGGVATWDGLLTRTAGGVINEAVATLGSLAGEGSHARAPEARLTLLPGGAKADPATAFRDLKQATEKLRAQSGGNVYAAPLPSASYTPEVPEPNLPATWLGRLVSDSGIGLYALNRDYRVGAAVLLQVLGPIGLLVVGLGRRQRWLRQPEFLFLGAGFFLATVIQIAVPSTSLSYGPARSFQQTLFVLSAFMAVATLSLAPKRLPSLSVGVSGALALLIAATDTGLVPQALGGYPPQLNLNGSGNYYDLYFVSGAEVAGIIWLGQNATGYHVDIAMDPNAFNASRPVQPLSANPNIYPSALHRDSWVFLSPTNVLLGKTEVSPGGYELWYRYPLGFLAGVKDRVYDNGSVYIYR